MTDIQKEIKEAFDLVSAISVSGDAVDVISAIRIHLRAAYNAAKSEEAEKDG